MPSYHGIFSTCIYLVFMYYVYIIYVLLFIYLLSVVFGDSNLESKVQLSKKSSLRFGRISVVLLSCWSQPMAK